MTTITEIAINVVGFGHSVCEPQSVQLRTYSKAAANSTFAKWRVEEVLVRSISNLTFVASRRIEVPNPQICKSSNRYGLVSS